MADVNVRSAADVPLLTASYLWRYVLTFCSNSDQTAVTPFFAPITNEEDRSVYNLPAGNTVLTLAIARYDLIVANSAAPTTLEIPANSTLGYTYTAGREIAFYVQSRGAGGLSINYSGTAALVIDNDIDPSTLGQRHPPVCVTSSVVDQWNYE
jgi:hypothetical protein